MLSFTNCIASMIALGAVAAGSARAEGKKDMVSLPGRTFRLGSTDGDADERPVRRVTLRPFSLDRTEVTVAAYAACVAAGQCPQVNARGYCNATLKGRERHPINCVDWEQARAYCAWAGKRLPMEEEWEYAARGGARGLRYPWGNGAPGQHLCWQRVGTCEAGSYPAGAFGLKDMAGNVWEWTASPYCPTPGGACKESPTRVVRGGSWIEVDPRKVRGAERQGFPPTFRTNDLGFRCARDGAR